MINKKLPGEKQEKDVLKNISWGVTTQKLAPSWMFWEKRWIVEVYINGKLVQWVYL